MYENSRQLFGRDEWSRRDDEGALEILTLGRAPLNARRIAGRGGN